MRILYLVGFTDWWGNYPSDILERDDAGTVGGGEAAALYTAFWLGEHGHEVTYCSVASPGEYRGVRFTPLRDSVGIGLEGDWDAVVGWGNLAVLNAVGPGPARLFAQQLNDLRAEAGWSALVDVVVSPSHTHAKLMHALLEDPGRQVVEVVYNGFDPALFPWPPPLHPRERPMTVGWWSSPDRGLHLLLAAWSRIRSQVPDATLKVFYQVRKYIEIATGAPGRPAFLAHLLEVLLDRTLHLGVELVDAIPRRVLAKEQAQVRVQAYPCDPDGFTEGFACSINEAMGAGCLPIVRLVDALPELWGDTAVPLEGDPPTGAFLDEIAEKVCWGLTAWSEEPGCTNPWGGKSPTLQDLRDHAERFTWDSAGEQMEGVIQRAVARKASG